MTEKVRKQARKMQIRLTKGQKWQKIQGMVDNFQFLCFMTPNPQRGRKDAVYDNFNNGRKFRVPILKPPFGGWGS